MPPLGHRDTRYSGYPEPAVTVPAPAGQAHSRDAGRSELRSTQVRPGIRHDESTVIKYLSMAGGGPEQAGGAAPLLLPFGPPPGRVSPGLRPPPVLPHAPHAPPVP